ncbi:MAG: hypothetical protein JY451_03225 [Erythrobacter sp.]|nr:MAG: hypothetical protein JY451_03225 [Erythrobacter sp.]
MPNRRTILFALAGMALLVLLVAWWDGGREEQRLIVEPLDLPERDS